ncbi:MAG TPA: NAD(P)-binding domain-containing protein [Gemmatimonadaceae bacterium]|nr:NAD(P)-binding domain-containing protein [Gemmatimonadaceae bacterium]
MWPDGREAGNTVRQSRAPGEDADVVLLAVHWSRVDDVLHQAGDLSGKIILSCTLPMNRDDSALAVAHTTSGAEAIARKKGKARVVSAFSTAPSEVLFDVFAKRRRKMRPSMVFCGDDKRAKKVAATLIRQLGFDPVDVGPLETARYIEPASLLIAKIAYDGDAGPAVAYRFEYLEERS